MPAKTRNAKLETVHLMSLHSLDGNARLFLGLMDNGLVKLVASNPQHKQPVTLIVPAEALHTAARTLDYLSRQRN